MIGTNLEVRGLVGHRHKDALGSRIGSYTAWFEEGELSGRIAGEDRALASLRTEQREYTADTLGIPSSRITEASMRYERSVSSVLRPYTEHDFEWQDYREASDIFQDNRGWTGKLGTDLFWSALMGDRTDGSEPFHPDLRLRFGGKYEVFAPGAHPRTASSSTRPSTVTRLWRRA
jgi:hypothetical protein